MTPFDRPYLRNSDLSAVPVQAQDMADEMFLRMMIPHHQRAIDMSEKALQRSERPEVKDLARTIIDEQSAEIKQMKGYLEDLDA